MGHPVACRYVVQYVVILNTVLRQSNRTNNNSYNMAIDKNNS